MSDVWVIGASSTGFRKWPDRTHRDLAEEAVTSALADAGFADGAPAEAVWFGNCAMNVFGQDNIRGQVALQPLVRAGRLDGTAPIVNVEGGCATGTAALHGAFTAVASGQVGTALAVGVEKTWVPDDPMKSFQLFLGGIDQLHPDEWQGFYAEAGARAGQTFAPHPARVVFLDIHAMAARRHMERFKTTAEHLAAIAAKNHENGKLNDKAQFRFGATVESVLADRPVVAPFTRSMCAPISDGAAAVVLVDAQTLAGLPGAVRERAVRVRACALGGGTWRELDAPGVVAHTAARAYRRAGLGPADIQLAEVHDANAWSELHALEELGFCGLGEGGPYAASGATQRAGERPVNASGGLIAKGHPLGATGLGMIDELVAQLRGEAGERQVPGAPTLALQQNAGGMVGFDEALCGVTILERA
ncbi:MAG: thiolase family protein [Alphaproteobacteria bacterium]|nr:thiolase family protein [Alphaproteobacteria bacterium]